MRRAFPGLLGLLLAAVPASAQFEDAGFLERPGWQSTQSGIGIVSGWKCEANAPLYASFDGGERFEMSYGTTREDTRAICGDDDNAFVLLWNYSNLTPGQHVLEIWEGDTLWEGAIFTVERFGTPFLRGASGCYDLAGFPDDGDITSIRWQTAAQGFVLASSCAVPRVAPGAPTGAMVLGVVENPGPGAVASGIGLVSGWRCEAGTITARFDGGDPIEVAYGTARGDTEFFCGDIDNGYALQWNYGLLGEGPHVLELFDDGEGFASVDFEVVSLGAFVRGLEGEFDLQGFPEGGDVTTVEWRQSLQGFVVVDWVPGSGPTPLPSPSPTPTRTPAPTPAPTASPSPSPGPTVTPSPSPVPTVTPSPSPGPTVTPSPSPVPTVTPSPSPVPTVTPSPSPVPTASPSPSPAPTVTPSPTPVPTASPSPTPVPTASPSPTPVPTASPSPTPAPTASPAPTPAPTASPAPTPTPPS